MPARQILLLMPDRPLRLDADAGADLRVDSGIAWLTGLARRQEAG